MQLLRTLLLTSVLLVSSSLAMGQQTVKDATIGGRITDPSGAGVAGAAVTARHLDTDVVSATASDADGHFGFPPLRIGTYELTVTHPGFAANVRPITVGAGSAFTLPIVLTVDGVSTSVIVTIEAPVLESARSQVATTVAEAELQRLPLNGRHFLDVALLAPSVAPPNINSTQVFAETSAVAGVGLSVGSQRNFSNSVIVDGLSANDDAAGLSGMPYAVDAVEQVQVVTSGGQAEFGRALGGYVNIVTRSGTNDMHGTVYGYVRDDRLNAANALSGTVLPMSQQQYGGSLGGPLVRNRTFFFGNAERRDLDQTGLVTISPANAATINAHLAASGYPGAPVTTGPYDVPVDTTNVLGKVDHVVSGRQQVGVRYALYDVAAENVRGAGGLAAPSASTGLDNRDHALAVSNMLTVGDRTVVETRAQFTHSDLRALPADRVGPAVSIAGVATFGTMSSSPQGRMNRMWQVAQTASQQRGAHALRAGLDIVRNDDRIVFPRTRLGSYAFASLPAFLAGTYNNAGFTQTFGTTEVDQSSTNVGVYLQDAWNASSALTLNLGLRYDLQFLETIRADTDNVSPRLGFAWTPSASRSLVVRGNAGLFFDRVPLRPLANALLSAGNTTDLAQLRQVSVSLSPGQAAAPAFPVVLASPVATVTLANLTTMEQGLQHAGSRQASIEVEHQIGRLTTVSVGYSHIRSSNLLMAINRNVPACLPTGNSNACRPIAQYGNDSRYSSAGSSTYHGLVVTLVQRPSRWGSYRATYTLSKAMNDVGEFFFSGPIDPLDVSKDWGRSDNDRRHMFVLAGSVNTPMRGARNAWQLITHGFQLSAMLQAYSAAPFNITSGVTTLQGTAGRPIVNGSFIARNSGIGDGFASLGMRVSRTIPLGHSLRLEAIAEVFNVTNAVNEVARNTNFGTGAYPANASPAFGQVTAVGEPRTAQVALRLRF